MGDLAVDVALQVRVRHAEGPMWDAPTARLWWGSTSRASRRTASIRTRPPIAAGRWHRAGWPRTAYRGV